MNQNFKIKMIAILATISGPAIAPCFALQDAEQLDETNSNAIEIVRTTETAPSNAFGAIRAADPVPKQDVRNILPPIVTGQTEVLPTSPPPIFVAPPIVQADAIFPKPVPAPAVEPQVLELPPIIVAGANDAFTVPDNTPNSALPIPDAMPLSPLAPMIPTAQLAEESTTKILETTVGAPRVPSDLILMEIPPTVPEIAETASPEKTSLPGTFVEPVPTSELIVDAAKVETVSVPPIVTGLKNVEKVEPNTASQIADNPNASEESDQNQDLPEEAISQAAKWNQGQTPSNLSKAGVSLYANQKQERTGEVEQFIPPIVSGKSLSEVATTPQSFVPEIVQGEAKDSIEIVNSNQDATAPVKNSPMVAPDSPREQFPVIVQGSTLPPRAPEISPQSIPVPPSRELIAEEPTPIAPPKALAINEAPTPAPNPLPETPQNPIALPVAELATPLVMEEKSNPIAANPPIASPASTRVAAQPKATPTYFDTLPGEPSSLKSAVKDCLGCSGSGCPECGVMSTAEADYAACQSCGSRGCFDSGTVAARFGNSGSVSSARKYFIFDAIYLDRYDGTIAISNFGGLNNFENNLFGARATIGRREDAANGDELSYFGSANLSESAFHTDPLGRITVGFPSTGAFAVETTAFRNAVEQSQSKSTMFQSLEYNRNDWGWDVIRTFVGLRYIYIQDEYQITSQNLAGETGDFELSTRNNLLGGHLGYELFYDVGYRLSWSTIGKFGVYANPNRVKTKLNNAGVQFLDLTDTNTAFSGTIELGLNGHYKLGKRSRLRFGYNAFWLGEVASTADNIPVTINPTTGSDTSDSDDMFFHGLSLGLEIFR